MTITTPPLRCANSVMTADLAHSKIVLMDTGNYPSYSTFLNETWTFASGQWTATGATLIDPNGPLPGRINGVMCYDGTGVMLYGGQGGSSSAGVLEDTWLWNNTSWSQASPTTVPFGRYNMESAYSFGNGVVMFGGETVGNILEETWLWNHTNWSQVSTTTTPAARIGHVMAGQSGADYVFMFGGKGTNSQFNDSWKYTTAGGWVALSPTGTPSIRSGACMCWDSVNSLFVMFGGNNEYNYLDETWTFNPAAAGTWTKVSVAGGAGPAGRVGAMMAFDVGSGQSILFGGVDAATNYPSNSSWSFNSGTGVWTLLG